MVRFCFCCCRPCACACGRGVSREACVCCGWRDGGGAMGLSVAGLADGRLLTNFRQQRQHASTLALLSACFRNPRFGHSRTHLPRTTPPPHLTGSDGGRGGQRCVSPCTLFLFRLDLESELLLFCPAHSCIKPLPQKESWYAPSSSSSASPCPCWYALYPTPLPLSCRRIRWRRHHRKETEEEQCRPPASPHPSSP